MKHSTAKSILRCLHNERLESFFAILVQGGNGKLLEKICRFIHEAGDVSETDIMRRFKLTRGQYAHWMDAIAERMAQFLIKDGKVAYLGQASNALCLLIAAMEYEAATELLQLAIQEACTIENFDVIVHFCELAKTMKYEPDLPVQLGEAIRQQENLLAYKGLLHRYEYHRDSADYTKKAEFMQAALTNDLLNGNQPPLSTRATYLYLKLRASILAQLSQYPAAMEIQTTLVAHIETNPWISDIEDLAYVEELSRYTILLYRTGDRDKFHEFSQSIQTLGFKNQKAESERIRFLYPFCIGVAIEDGNLSATVSTITGFIKLLEESGSQLDKSFITLNLLHSLSGAIASNNNDLRKKLTRLLYGHRKADFSPKHYTMYRFLEVIHAMEEGEWEDAKRLVANRIKQREDSVMPKITETLRFLSYLITLMEVKTDQKPYAFPTELHELLESLLIGSPIVDYFDLQAWVVAKERGCSMLDIFREKASSPGPLL